ncbi:MAG TPA: bifunctional adenosylcobinamide kinase/adenosylcobinamide-phosphate guanylyltransferase [Oxalicibacterium sp.]|uniref:bifunctional adenosylcobinamide kinase/adenosylcobinamide-phosphate guanylyltransferase n=1 Tax=Oxalicibacterium sp. TaxID=2766525 RepID=UPI002B896C15|nr:bifunctional adenosylcobinamide kinase/adenosylcobinamide-phosphate guanylyltransferase [Oxalicibacterium sp.]HWU99121.1 bifunctional adenosylcobinamide kinase/adenosylcobinamide-phosphate guanylyltransferase [Oxalicibacterium sp.]
MTVRTLIIGGARSGKSAHAERLAISSGKKVVYIATARAGDEEMQQRIAHHRQRRSIDWFTVEEPLALGDAIERHAAADSVILVDCLTVWLANLLFFEQRDFPEVGVIDASACFSRQRAGLLQVLEHAAGDVLLVTNEVGQGVIPQGAVSRWFVDESGRLNQDVAAVCDRATLIVAGLPVSLKG